MKLHFVIAGVLCAVALVKSSPVNSDVAESESFTTTLSPADFQENEISQDETIQGTTEQIASDAIVTEEEAWEAAFNNLNFPIVPEESGNEVPQFDPIPTYFDEAEFGVSKRVMDDSTMEYYVGRAQCQCGSPGNRMSPLRIVNGTVIRINDYPWTVALIRKRIFGEPKGAYCGGTLINNRYILTASHCVDGIEPRQIEVWVHEEDFAAQNEVEGGTQRFQVEKITMHPFYNRRTIDNDIALIKLADPVQLDNVIVPACLPANNDYLFEGIESTVAGWGTTVEGGSTSNTLMKVDVPIISNSDCNSLNSYKGKITENMLCAGFVKEGGKDSCQGDSGGPLTIENGGRRTQVGVVSWGYGCARPGAPGVYTRVGKYTQWIVSTSKGAAWCSL